MVVVYVQFKSLKDRNEAGERFNTAYREYFVPKIKRWCRVHKERERYYFAIIAFDCFPMQKIVCLMRTVAFYTNSFVWSKCM